MASKIMKKKSKLSQAFRIAGLKRLIRKQARNIQVLQEALDSSKQEQNTQARKCAELVLQTSNLILETEKLQTENWNVNVSLRELEEELKKSQVENNFFKIKVGTLNDEIAELASSTESKALALQQDTDIITLNSRITTLNNFYAMEKEQRRHLEKQTRFLIKTIKEARVTFNAVEADINLELSMDDVKVSFKLEDS